MERTVFHLLECICDHTKDYGRGQGRSIVTVAMCLEYSVVQTRVKALGGFI